MNWFMCVYPAWPSLLVEPRGVLEGDLSSFIWARNAAHAEKLARQRNLGEAVVCRWGGRGMPYVPVSEQLRRRSLTPKQKLNAIHHAIFLSYLLQRSLGAPAEAILGDEGLLHQLLHHLSFGYPRKAALIATFQHFEAMVPGYGKKA